MRTSHEVIGDIFAALDPEPCCNPQCKRVGAWKCMRCKVVRYCSRTCQRTDYSRHRRRCKATKIVMEPCFNLKCKKGGTKKCMGCKVARYCSRPCQRADFRRHKSHCENRSDPPVRWCEGCGDVKTASMCDGCDFMFTDIWGIPGKAFCSRCANTKGVCDMCSSMGGGDDEVLN